MLDNLTKAQRKAIEPTERVFMEWVRDLALVQSWAYYHTYRSIHSEPGFPDLTLLRPPRLIFAELKVLGGRVQPSQQKWLNNLKLVDGVEVYLWTPREWDDGTIERILR